MFPYPVGSILWGSAAVALLKDAITIQEIFQYPLPNPHMHLEEFQASLTLSPVENRGSILLIQITVDMIALFQNTRSGERQTLKRREPITRRFPLSAFLFAEENHQPLHPEKWEAAIHHFTYCPDIHQETLTIKISFSLHICGTQNQLLSLPELLPLCAPTPQNGGNPLERTQIQALQQEIQHCRETIASLQQQIRHLKNQTPTPEKTDLPAPSKKATIGKTTTQYRQTHRLFPE